MRPRAPLLTVNLLISCELLEAIKRVQDMVKDIKVRHTYIRDGVYYFERRVPKDLHFAYKKPKIVMSLKTKKFAHARRAAICSTQTLGEHLPMLQLDALRGSDQLHWVKIVSH